MTPLVQTDESASRCRHSMQTDSLRVSPPKRVAAGLVVNSDTGGDNVGFSIPEKWAFSGGLVFLDLEVGAGEP